MVETSSTAIAAREKAIIEAQYIMAMRRPRNVEEVRVRMLRECDRPGFAEVARYRKPVGSKMIDGEWIQQYAEGYSIRFAEMAIRHMGNIKCDALPIYDDDAQRIVLQSVIDLESNSSYTKPITISKTVERRKLKQGQDAIAERTNSKGDKVFIVAATEDEIGMKESSSFSKFVRNALRFVPGDVLDECESRITKTLESADRQNPDESKRKVIDAFVAIGVGPVDLQMYLGHPIDRMQPAELAELRGVYAAIKEGEITWQAILEAKNPAGTVEAAHDLAEKKLAALREKQKPQSTDKPAEQTSTAAETPAPEAAKSEGPTPEQPVGEQSPAGKGSKLQFGKKQ